MAEELAPSEENSIDPFDAPTPGASLTSDPENRAPFEKPPQFTDPQEAVEEIFFRMTENEDNLNNVLDLMRDDVPLEDITQTILYRGFSLGLWTPDMVIQLVEPVIYILINLGEYAGIEVTLYPEEDFDVDDEYESDDDRAKAIRKLVAGETKEALAEAGDASEMAPPDVVPASLQERIKAKVSKAEEVNV